MFRQRPMAWAFPVWALLIAAAMALTTLTAPHYVYMMTVPGGANTWAALFGILGLCEVVALVANRDGLYRFALGAMSVANVMVASALLMAATTISNAVNLGPLTWGMVGVVGLLYALPTGDVDK